MRGFDENEINSVNDEEEFKDCEDVPSHEENNEQ